MTKRITVTLTEDQRLALIIAVQDSFDYDSKGDWLKSDMNSFRKRLLEKLSK